MFSVEFPCDFEIYEVVVVGIDDGLVWVAYEVWSPSCEGMYDGKKFLVIDVPVSLRGIESSGKESDGMELAFLIPLLKDGANSVSGGVAIDRESVFESGLPQDGGGANSIHEGVKGGFQFIVPIKLPSFRAEGNEHVKRCGQHAKVANIHAIEIQEAEESPNFLQG